MYSLSVKRCVELSSMSSNIDRRWMYEMTNSQGLLNLYWCNLVETEFLDIAFSQTQHVRKRTVDGRQIFRIRCPCLKCKLKPFLKREEVKYHVCTNGFVADYKTWLSHGEIKDNCEDTVQCSNPSRDDNPNFGCRQMVLDNIYASFPSINASNVFEQQNPSKSAQQFYYMLEADNEPLYGGCQNWSKLQAATSLLNWKSECNVPDSTFDKLVPFIKSWLPADNKLVENFYETKKTLKKLRLPVKKIHACKNHCMLFDGVNSSLTHCQVCKTAKDMIWHSNHQSEEGSMVHPSDGKAWKHFDSTDPFFAEEIRNVRLGLCTDGFSPNSSSSNPYSCWPVFLSIYNLPPWMALKDSYVKLALIIRSRKSPGQNIDVFLRPLIDELKILYDNGVETYDAYRKTNFTLRAILLWTVSDFPGYAMLSGWSTHGKLACPYCMDKTDAFQLRNGGNFKSYECHVFMQRLLPIALKGMILNAIWDAITDLCTFFRAICSKVLHIEDLKKLRESIVVTICKLEKVFPPGFFDSMEHLVIHLVNEAILGGPVQYRWMYIYEKKLSSLKRTIRNKSKVEGSIFDSNLVHELSTQYSLYLDLTIETWLNRDPQNYAPDISSSSSTDSKLSIFKVPSRRLFNKKGREVTLTPSERHKAHTYVLLNCQEVQPFISSFDSWIRETSPHIDVNSLSIAREQKFAKWFKEHVFERLNEHLKCLARGPLHNVKSYEGYLVNGYKFHTKKHGTGQWPVVKTKPRSSYEVAQSAFVVDDNDNVEEEDFFQESERLIFNLDTSTSDDMEHVCLVTEGEIEDISNDYVDNTHSPINDDEQEFIDSDDDSNENVDEELNLADYSSDGHYSFDD
ncbi:putative transposase-associated domain-containing protein [Tanacetum coccineum]